jgi:tRNA dimethylallyltransferase
VLREQLAVTPLPELLEELAARDPDAYQWIDRANRRRVERAVEVIRLTGRPFSTQRAHWTEKPAHEAELRTKTAPTGPPASVADPEPPPGASGLRLVVLTREAGDLKARIDARVEAMFARGLVAETEALLARGLERNRTALQALGYRQVVEHLRGVRCLADTVALVKRKTRQYAKRQLAWFRHQLRAEWVVLAPTSEPAQVAEHLLAHHFKACAR